MGFAQERLPAQKENILLKNSKKSDYRRRPEGRHFTKREARLCNFTLVA